MNNLERAKAIAADLKAGAISRSKWAGMVECAYDMQMGEEQLVLMDAAYQAGGDWLNQLRDIGAPYIAKARGFA